MELRFVLKQIDIHTKHWQTQRRNKHVNFHQDSLWNTFLTILHPQILRCRNLLCVGWRILPPEAGRRSLLACSPSGSPTEYLHKVEKNGKGEHHKNNLCLLETLNVKCGGLLYYLDYDRLIWRGSDALTCIYDQHHFSSNEALMALAIFCWLKQTTDVKLHRWKPTSIQFLRSPGVCHKYRNNVRLKPKSPLAPEWAWGGTRDQNKLSKQLKGNKALIYGNIFLMRTSRADI